MEMEIRHIPLEEVIRHRFQSCTTTDHESLELYTVIYSLVLLVAEVKGFAPAVQNGSDGGSVELKETGFAPQNFPAIARLTLRRFRHLASTAFV